MDNFYLNVRNHKYWLFAGCVFLLIIALIYPSTNFKSMKMEITRSQAITLAENFLKNQKVNIDDYLVEGFIQTNPPETNYLLKKLGPENFDKAIKHDSFPLYGWDIRLYKNQSQGDNLTSYSVNVSYSGKITGFRRIISDTTSMPGISVDSAKGLISKFINKVSGVDLKQFNLTVSKVDNFSKRKDFTFIWEREIKELNSKWVVRSSVQGNQPGSFLYSFEIPQEEKTFLDTGQVFVFTISVIFIFFLTQFAIYLFLKKYHEGEVWINVGKTLFLVFFAASWVMLINSWPELGHGLFIGSLNLLMVKLIAFASIGILVYFFLGLLVFSSWSVGESYAREFWPEKLKGIDAFIKGHIFSIPSGFSLMRGMIIGLFISLLYMVLSLVLGVKNSPVMINVSNYLNIYSGFSPFVDLIFSAFTFTIMSGIGLNFFPICITYNKWKRKWIAIIMSGIITMAGSVIAANTIPLNAIHASIIFSFLIGCFSAYIFFKYDLLTLLSINFHVYLVMNSMVLFRSGTSYYQWNYIFAAAAILIVPFIYIIARIRKTDFALDNYGLPSHIKKISERERLKKEMEIAARVQLSLLPMEQPKLPGYEIASTSIPAKEAGGDYYDFIKLNTNKLGIAVGDVSGKGIGAAIYMTLTKGIFQAHADEDAMPLVVLGKVNKLLYKTIEKNSFVSMIYAILDTNTNSIVYSRAGHNPGILISSDNCSTQLLRSNGIALGLDSGVMFNKVLVEEKIDINPKDVIVFYTDGFVEAMNEKLEEYGEERLLALIKDNYDKSPKELLQIILKDVRKFMDVFPQHDDMTMVILKRIS